MGYHHYLWTWESPPSRRCLKLPINRKLCWGQLQYRASCWETLFGQRRSKLVARGSGPPPWFAISHHSRMGKPMKKSWDGLYSDKPRWLDMDFQVSCLSVFRLSETNIGSEVYTLHIFWWQNQSTLDFSVVGSSSGLRMTTTIRHISATGRALGWGRRWRSVQTRHFSAFFHIFFWGKWCEKPWKTQLFPVKYHPSWARQLPVRKRTVDGKQKRQLKTGVSQQFWLWILRTSGRIGAEIDQNLRSFPCRIQKMKLSGRAETVCHCYCVEFYGIGVSQCFLASLAIIGKQLRPKMSPKSSKIHVYFSGPAGASEVLRKQTNNMPWTIIYIKYIHIICLLETCDPSHVSSDLKIYDVAKPKLKGGRSFLPQPRARPECHPLWQIWVCLKIRYPIPSIG